VRRHHKRRGTEGRIWQGPFRSFPIEQDAHLLTVMRYTERNPLRASLVERAEQWPWSSLHEIVKAELSISLETPVERPDDWLVWTNEPQSADEEAALRLSIRRSRPYGGKAWTVKTAVALGMEQSLHKSGPRARKTKT
jgi:putative transposase